MCKKSALLMLVMLVILVFTVGGGVQAGEIIYVDDIRENVITKEVLVRTADNVIVLVDTSSSLAAINKTYKKPYYELEKAALTTGFGRLPDLGYNVFDLDKSDPTAAGQEALTNVGKFMVDNPSAYTVLFGYTDDTGKPE